MSTKKYTIFDGGTCENAGLFVLRYRDIYIREKKGEGEREVH